MSATWMPVPLAVKERLRAWVGSVGEDVIDVVVGIGETERLRDC